MEAECADCGKLTTEAREVMGKPYCPSCAEEIERAIKRFKESFEELERSKKGA